MSANTVPHATDRQRFCHLRELGLELDRFFDVGASSGCWSQKMSQAFPNATFELFEPLVDYVPDYRQRMAEVLAESPRFHLHKVALGAECRTTMMHIPSKAFGSTALEMGAGVPADWRSLKVEMLTIDHVIQEFRLPAPQAIKIDTQGCELNILQGARETLPEVSVLLLECWLTRSYGPKTPLLSELTHWLTAFDFYLWDLGDEFRDPRGILVSQDCFFVNARSPVSRLSAELSRAEPADPESATVVSSKGRSSSPSVQALLETTP